VPHDGIFGETLRYRVRITAILGVDVDSDGRRRSIDSLLQLDSHERQCLEAYMQSPISA